VCESNCTLMYKLVFCCSQKEKVFIIIIEVDLYFLLFVCRLNEEMQKRQEAENNLTLFRKVKR